MTNELSGPDAKMEPVVPRTVDSLQKKCMRVSTGMGNPKTYGKHSGKGDAKIMIAPCCPDKSVNFGAGSSILETGMI